MLALVTAMAVPSVAGSKLASLLYFTSQLPGVVVLRSVQLTVALLVVTLEVTNVLVSGGKQLGITLTTMLSIPQDTFE